MAHVRRVHASPGRQQRILDHAEDLGLDPEGYAMRVTREVREFLAGLGVGVLMNTHRYRKLLEGEPGRASVVRERGRREFEGQLFSVRHPVTYGLLLCPEAGVPEALRRDYGPELVRLVPAASLDATVVLGDSLTDGEGLFEDRGMCTLDRPSEVLFDFTFEPLAAMADGDPFTLGDAAYLEVQLRRELRPEGLLPGG